jgi:hypothetical protein
VQVWTAARRLRDYLEAEQAVLGLRRSGLRVLELGAGCGWLGLTVAHNLTGCSVLLTEQQTGGAVEHLLENIAVNRHLVDDRHWPLHPHCCIVVLLPCSRFLAVMAQVDVLAWFSKYSGDPCFICPYSY